MELRVLRYFMTVAREQNITRAAAMLHITQPTLSRQLMQLEEELHTKLFERGKGVLRLTNDGRLLCRRAEELLALANKTEKEFSVGKTAISGEIFIGSAETDTFHHLAKLMKEFSNTFPNVKYNLFSGNADDIKEKINNGLIDIAMLTEPVAIDNTYYVVHISEKQQWGVLIPKQDALAQRSYVTKEDLLQHPLIITKRDAVQDVIKHWYDGDFEKQRIIACYNLMFNAAILVEEGLGYAITIDHLMRDSEAGNVCFRPLKPFLETGNVIVWKKDQVFTPAVTEFMKRIQELDG